MTPSAPYVDEGAAEELFRHRVLGLLRGQGLLGQERIELLMSWRRSGFSVHNRVYAHPGDGRDFEALVRYMMRSPISLSRLRFTPGGKRVRPLPLAGVALVTPNTRAIALRVVENLTVSRSTGLSVSTLGSAYAGRPRRRRRRRQSKGHARGAGPSPALGAEVIRNLATDIVFGLSSLTAVAFR